MKTPAREIEDGSVANLRMEVLGDHLFVSPLDGLEKRRGGEGGDGDDGVETREGDEYDEQARAEDPTDDQPTGEKDARKEVDVEDVQPLVVDLPEDGALEASVKCVTWDEPTGTDQVGDHNTQEESVEEEYFHPHQLPSLSPLTDLRELDAEEDVKAERRKPSGSDFANMTFLTDLDPDIDADPYNACLRGEDIHTSTATPGPADNPELVVKKELGFGSISFKRESLSPLTSLSENESEGNAYLDGKRRKRKLGWGAEERRESKKVKARPSGATGRRQTARSPGILLQDVRYLLKLLDVL